MSLVIQEPTVSPRCCSTNSALWNEICRDLAGRDLMRAWMTLDGDDSVRLDTIATPPWHPADTLTAEALSRGADEIVLADPVGSGLAAWVETGRLGPDGAYAVEGIGGSEAP